MLSPLADMPAGVLGLSAAGTVISQDVGEALALLRAANPSAGGLAVVVTPDFDGYLSELIAGLGDAASVDKPLFKNWALVLPDDMVAEATQLGGAGKVSIFPQSRREAALALAASG